jgi:hypothetical protein
MRYSTFSLEVTMTSIDVLRRLNFRRTEMTRAILAALLGVSLWSAMAGPTGAQTAVLTKEQAHAIGSMPTSTSILWS